MTGRPPTPSRSIARALDGLAAEIAGEREPEPSRAAPDGRDPVGRSALLRGAALLTGRGDLAQDATHAATARARLASGERSGRMALYAEVLRVARSMPPDA